MAVRVPAAATPATLLEIATGIEQAFETVFGRPPIESEARWLMALVMAENQSGQKIIAHNWGNRAFSPAAGDVGYWVPSWADTEIPDEALSPASLATRVRMHQGEPVPDKFAAYNSHVEGATKFMRLFKSETHERILKAARNDDAEAFWKGIGTPHPRTRMRYCVECYTKAHLKLYKSLAQKVQALGLFDHLEKKNAVPTPEGSY